MVAINVIGVICLVGVVSAHYGSYHNGLWKREGLHASQWHGEGQHAGQWHGEGQHAGQWHGEGQQQGQWHGEGHKAGQWHGEGHHAGQWHGGHGSHGGYGGGHGHHGSSGYHHYGPAQLGHDGRVVDTPEVAHARAVHSQAYHQAANGGHGGYGGHHSGYGGHGQGDHVKWNGPFARVELTHDGKFLKNTPEVEHARAKHLSAVSTLKNRHGYSHKGY